MGISSPPADRLGIAVTERADDPPALSYFAEVAAFDPDLDLAVLRIVADVDSEIKRVIAKQVGRRIEAPEAQQAKVVDIGKRIASAWTGV